MQLYRPIGLKELRLVAKTGFTEFPPRLPHQPIFYPVLDLEYARQIARDWNPTDELSEFVGFVTEFNLDDSLATKYPVQIAGSSKHRELWVPAHELPDFNAHLLGPIRVIEAFPGHRFDGTIDPSTHVPMDF